jgi:hypothetical protein
LFTRLQFSWTEQEYTVWSSVSTIATAVATFSVMPLLSYKMGLHDTIIGIIGAVTGIAATLNTAFATEPWMLYLSKYLPNMFLK